MIQHYITVALRNLRKYPTQTIISVLGLAAGFVCLSLSALWMRYENTYDTMHKDYERIYTFTNAENLERAGLDYSRTRLMTTSTLVNAMRNEYPEVEAVTYCSFLDESAKINGLGASIMIIDTTFIRVFDLPLVQGDYDFLTDHNEVAITEEFAKRLFPDEEEFIGKDIDGNTEIGAVIKGYGTHSIIQFDVLTTRKFHINDQQSELIPIFAKIYETASADSLAARIQQHKTWGMQQNIITIPLVDAHKLAGNFLSLSWEHLRVFLACSALLIVCALINYLVLYLIRLRGREREMALRIVNGSTVGGLMTMFLIEVAVVLLASILLGLLGIELLYDVFTRFAQIDMDYGCLFGSALLIMLATAVLCFMLCILPIAIVRNRTLTGRTQRNDTFRKASSFVQLTVSMVFIFCTVVMLHQIVFMRNTDWGFSIKGKATLEILSVADPNNPYESAYSFKKARDKQVEVAPRLRELPMVIDAKEHTSDFISPEFSKTSGTIGLAPTPEALSVIGMYFRGLWDIGNPVYGFTVLEGTLPREHEWKPNEVVITEKVRRKLGLEQAVGHTLYTNPGRGFPYTDNSCNTFTVVAVIKDIYFQSPTEEAFDFVFFPKHQFKELGYRPSYITISYYPNKRKEFTRSVHELMEKKFPEAEYKLIFSEDIFNDKLKSETNLMLILGIITLVCILVAIFGVYSIVTLACAQRRKEIALRKIHGATLRDILGIFVKEYGLIVLAASAVAFPIGYIIMKQWIVQYVKQAPIAWWIYVSIFLAIVLLIALSVGSRVWRTVRENPAEVVKSGN